MIAAPTEGSPLAEQPPSPGQGAEPDELALLARLRDLHAASRVRVAADRSKLSHIDFPLSFEADGNRWAYAIVIVVVVVWWRFGIIPGVASAAAGLILYQTVARTWLARRLDRRIHEKGLAEIDTWRKLWRFGGVILTDVSSGQTCRGPDERWMPFVRKLDERSAP